MKLDDRVKLKGTDYIGTVTIVVDERQEAKVIFDDGDGPDYWYYPYDQLEIQPEETKK